MGTTKETNLNRIEELISHDDGEAWKLSHDITPQKGLNYQNIRTISKKTGGPSSEIIIFYGWAQDAEPGQAVAFLWDDRR